jgi:predicted N-acetyltransferase YhbS
MLIRTVHPGDLAAVGMVHREAFGGGDAFMALELQSGALRDCRGRIGHAPAFADLPA